MKLLVIGGAGYIGSHTVVELINSGFEPIIIDNFSNSDKSVTDNIQKVTGKSVKVFDINFQDTDKLTTIIKDNDIEGVIHFAAFKAVGESTTDPLKYYDNNVGGFIKLLEIVVKQKIKY